MAITGSSFGKNDEYEVCEFTGDFLDRIELQADKLARRFALPRESVLNHLKHLHQTPLLPVQKCLHLLERPLYLRELINLGYVITYDDDFELVQNIPGPDILEGLGIRERVTNNWADFSPKSEYHIWGSKFMPLPNSRSLRVVDRLVLEVETIDSSDNLEKIPEYLAWKSFHQSPPFTTLNQLKSIPRPRVGRAPWRFVPIRRQQDLPLDDFNEFFPKNVKNYMIFKVLYDITGTDIWQKFAMDLKSVEINKDQMSLIRFSGYKLLLLHKRTYSYWSTELTYLTYGCLSNSQYWEVEPFDLHVGGIADLQRSGELLVLHVEGIEELNSSRKQAIGNGQVLRIRKNKKDGDDMTPLDEDPLMTKCSVAENWQWNKTWEIKQVTNEGIEAAIAKTNMRLVDVARKLGVSRATLKRRLKEYGISWSRSKKYRITRSSKSPSTSTSSADATSPNQSQRQVGNLSTIVVKAAYKEDMIKFGFSLDSSFDQLKEEMVKRLNLEPCNFKIKCKDDEDEWMLISSIADLRILLPPPNSSGKIIVRLLIVDR